MGVRAPCCRSGDGESSTHASKPFGVMVACLRDSAESQVRRRILELKVQLLQAENAIVNDRLGGWIEHILQTSV